MNTSEGALSASRILRAPLIDCGFGHCGAKVDCTGPCKLKAAVLNLPVIDEKFLDSQLQCDLPIEMIDPIPSVMSLAKWLKIVALVVALEMVFLAVLLASVR